MQSRFFFKRNDKMVEGGTTKSIMAKNKLMYLKAEGILQELRNLTKKWQFK
jgi:hypothetical protein